MSKHADFFQQPKPAAILKHALLREYTTVFVSMVSRWTTGPIWLIDGYAGPGSYAGDGNSPPVAGSPTIALDLASKQPRLRCAFVEKEPSHVEELLKLVDGRNGTNQATVYEGDVRDVLSKVWEQVGASPVVTFLDPFGVALERRLVADTLLSRRARTPSEVLINLNVESVWRIGGNLEERNGEIVPRSGQEKGIQKADAFFGSLNWRTTFYEARDAEDGSAARAAERVVNEYRDLLCQETGYQALSVPIRRRPNQPALFLLTLFFKHQAAGLKFADAASRANRKWREAYRKQALSEELANSQGSLFDPAEISETEAKRIEKLLKAEWEQQIASNIEAAILNRPDLRVSEVHAIFGQTLGLAGISHLQRAWDALATKGIVRKRQGPATWESVIHAESARCDSGI